MTKTLGQDWCYIWQMAPNRVHCGFDYLGFSCVRFCARGFRHIVAFKFSTLARALEPDGAKAIDEIRDHVLKMSAKGAASLPAKLAELDPGSLCMSFCTAGPGDAVVVPAGWILAAATSD